MTQRRDNWIVVSDDTQRPEDEIRRYINDRRPNHRPTQVQACVALDALTTRLEQAEGALREIAAFASTQETNHPAVAIARAALSPTEEPTKDERCPTCFGRGSVRNPHGYIRSGCTDPWHTKDKTP
jgi:hypothetical protein